MRGKRVAVAALAGAIVALAVCGDDAGAAASVALPNCAGVPEVKPAAVTLTCADAGVTVSDVAWTGWGAAFAAGVGTAAVNDCTPSCVAGHVHRYRVVLLAGGRQTCPGGAPAYAQVTYASIGASPYANGAPGTSDPVVPFRCRAAGGR